MHTVNSGKQNYIRPETAGTTLGMPVKYVSRGIWNPLIIYNYVGNAPFLPSQKVGLRPGAREHTVSFFFSMTYTSFFCLTHLTISEYLTDTHRWTEARIRVFFNLIVSSCPNDYFIYAM